MNNLSQILGAIGIVMICFSIIIGYIIKNPLLCLLFLLGFMIAGCTCLCFMGIVLNAYRIVVPMITFTIIMLAFRTYIVICNILSKINFTFTWRI